MILCPDLKTYSNLILFNDGLDMVYSQISIIVSKCQNNCKSDI